MKYFIIRDTGKEMTYLSNISTFQNRYVWYPKFDKNKLFCCEEKIYMIVLKNKFKNIHQIHRKAVYYLIDENMKVIT